MARYVIRVARQAVLVAVFLLVALLGAVSGLLFVYMDDLPQITALDDYSPSGVTRVLAADGQLVGEFATQRRVVVGFDDIAPVLRQAIIASEDEGFYEHIGLSISRIILTGLKDLRERRLAAGASTLTQQLARKLFLTDEKTWERKIREAILAIQIEKRYTKNEILTLYCNQMYLGSGAYGVEAASRLYFGKSAKDLALEEAALIAGIFQRPSSQSPYVNPEAAMRRRNYVLARMADAGFLTAAEADAAKQQPIVTIGAPPEQSTAAYFLEEVRQHLEARYGATQLYEGGLTVQTTLDVRLQEIANQVVRKGLRDVDKRRGFRKPARNLAAEGLDVGAFEHPRWRFPMQPGDIVPFVVVEASANEIRGRAGKLAVRIDREGFSWTRRANATQLVAPGDLVEVRIATSDAEAGRIDGSLEQEPELEGALLAIDNRTGQIRAMVGGLDFDRSKFNRAVQAFRQIGSTFKAFVYTAAIDRGYTPVSIIEDEPVSFPAGPGQPEYAPTNYDNEFQGPITLRRALERSRNVPAVRMMATLGPEQVVSYAQRFGLTGPMPPYLSLALGSSEATLLEVTSAFTVFPNQGVRMEPYQIMKVTDREGDVLEENRPQSREVIRADTAYVMTSLLRGVTTRGTAARAASLRWPLGGKTGTTDDWTDAWMVGFDPDLTVGVWLGHDVKRTLGRGESGTVAALPIWIEFMKGYIGDREDAPQFPAPGNIVRLTVDRNTGEVTAPWLPDAIDEVFISGTQPGAAFTQPSDGVEHP